MCRRCDVPMGMLCVELDTAGYAGVLSTDIISSSIEFRACINNNIHINLWYNTHIRTPTVLYHTYWGWVTHICATPLTEPFWNIVNCILGNKLQWNRNQNSYICIQENAIEIVVSKLATIFLSLNVLKCWCSEGTNELLHPTENSVFYPSYLP